MTIFFNFTTKCSNCNDIHSVKVEITETELMKMFQTWAADHEENVEIYMYKNTFMATTNPNVIEEYEKAAGTNVSVSMLGDRVDVCPE